MLIYTLLTVLIFFWKLLLFVLGFTIDATSIPVYAASSAFMIAFTIKIKRMTSTKDIRCAYGL